MSYVSDHAYAFSEVLRVLRPGGRFVINDVAAQLEVRGPKAEESGAQGSVVQAITATKRT